MKKRTAIILALVLCLSLFSACGESPTDVPDESAEVTGGAAEDTPINLAVSVGNYSSITTLGTSAQYFIDKVEEYSGGSVTADLYCDNSLGDLSSQAEAIAGGSIDVLIAGDSYFSPYVTELQAFELPFLFESVDEARYILDGAAGDYIKEKFEGTGIHILGFWEIGMRQLTSNGKQVTCLEDLKGMRLRVLPVDIQVYAWELFGANVIAIDGAELYSSLQTGVVDAQENPLDGIYSNKLYEVQEYITMTNHVFTPAAFSISESTWAKLSDNQKSAIEKAVDEATDYYRENMDKATDEALTALRDLCDICEDPDLSGFTELAPQVYDEFLKNIPSAEELLDIVYAERDIYRAG